MKDEKMFEFFNKKINDLNEKYIESQLQIQNGKIEITELKNEIGNLNYRLSTINQKKKKDYFTKIFNKLFPSESKFKMAINLLIHMIFHPIRAFSLVVNIKKFNYHFGDNLLDILYLKLGKITLKREKEPMVSIIIPVYNQIEYTYNCLKSIQNNTKDVSYEVIIADDVSIDGTRSLSAYVDNVIIIKNKQNMGFLKNCNNAALLAKGKYILFLNNDTRVKEGWLSSLVDLIENDSSIGMVGSKLVYPDGRLQEAGGVIYNDGTGCNYGKFDDPEKPEYNYVRDVDYISGASIMLSKKLWDTIGGFDLRYAPAYCEDSDLAFEVKKHGYRVVYQPKSVVIHYEGISNGTDVNNVYGLKHYQVANNKKLKEKWKKEIEDLPARNLNRKNIAFRDRIKNKRVVLIVDHYVPEFDKDAGSRTTFQYIKLLVKKGYVVKFLPDNFNNSKPYTEFLEQMGVEVLYGIWYKENINNWILLNKDNIDIAYLNRPHISIKYIDFIKENTSIKIIYYGHDLHFLREMREYEITKDEYHKSESEKWKEIELSIMRKADVVYYPSYVEENVIKKIDKKIPVKAINAYMFDKMNLNTKEDFIKRKGILFVGGFVHRPNLDAVMWFSKKIYPLIKKQLNIPFIIVGSNPTSEVKKLAGNGIIVKGFVSDEELKELYDNCRIVVAPLRYGAGIKGKIIEAMKHGIPIVTTSCGAEGIVDSEKFLSIADSDLDFANNVIELYDNVTKLEEISYNEKKYINENYSYDAAYKIIKADFQKIIDYLVITPDGYGSKGDEAMIMGLLSIVSDLKIKMITCNKKTWIDNLNIKSKNLFEEVVMLEELNNYDITENGLIILGADIIDGTCGLNDSIARLDFASRFAKLNKPVYIYCSFRSDVDQRIIDKISKLPPNVKIYLRDELSINNFHKQVKRDCSYFPDFAFFANKSETSRSVVIKEKLEMLSAFSYRLIGLNFSETSFRSLYKEINKENRYEYVRTVIETIINTVDNAYIVLISHDIRSSDEYLSDVEFQKIAVNILNELNFDKYFIVPEELCFTEILSFINNLDTVITGRMHLSISAILNKVIPIVYTGKTNDNNYLMIDKVRGMLINYLGDDTFAVSSISELKKGLKNILDNKIDYKKLKEKIIKTNLTDENEFIKMKKELLKNERM